jgi:hypothetical protein
MLGLILETRRCPDGFELASRDVRVTDYQHGTDWIEHKERFLSRTERREPLRVELRNLEAPAVLQFVNARDDGAISRFLSKYGWLSEEENPRYAPYGSEYELVSTSQKQFRLWLTSAGAGNPVEAVRGLLGEHYYEGIDFPGLGKIELEPTFHLPAEGGPPQMLLNCSDLTNFMKMEIAMVAMHGVKLATCEQCHDFFLTGPLTGRRSHAKYCSDRCRVAALRARNRAKEV